MTFGRPLTLPMYPYQGGKFMESIYLDREKLSGIKEMIIELGVSL